MFGVALVFGGTLIVAGTMTNPEGLRLAGLINYFLFMLILMPFGGGWVLLASQLVVPTAGRTRLAAVFNTWIGGTLLAVAVISWLASVMSYDPSGHRVDWSAHVLIPYRPLLGIGLGLFTVCHLVVWGLVGAISPILRPETAVQSAIVGGTVLFGVLYGAGWLLVT